MDNSDQEGAVLCTVVSWQSFEAVGAAGSSDKWNISSDARWCTLEAWDFRFVLEMLF